MSETRLEAVLWDLDGVIADTGDYHYGAWRDVFGKKGVAFSRKDFMRHFGQRHDTIIRFALGNNLSKDEFDAVTEEKQQNYRRRVAENIRALPGAIELIKSLNENGIKTAIASSAPLDNIEIIIKGLKIDNYFQAIAHGTEVSEGKPNPQIFLLAAKKLGVSPGNCVVIEDAIAGVAAAKTAGMKCVAVTNSHHQESLKKADLIVDTLAKVSIKELAGLFDNNAKLKG
jgi:beta-phosphoglucomutase family hydrolase